MTWIIILAAVKLFAGNIEVCKPVTDLVRTLEKDGSKIRTSRAGDYHFNEVYFLMTLPRDVRVLDRIEIQNIERQSEHIFTCKCHWSIVELAEE